jgi:hypothetical protein
MQLERAPPAYHLSPITRSIQDRSMQQNNGHLQPPFDLLALSKQRVCKAHQQARPHAPSRAADCKERHQPTDATAITVKHTKVEKKRPQVAFGCCLPRDPSAIEPRAAPSKLPRSNAAPPAPPFSSEETCKVMSVDATDHSCQPPALAQDADLSAAAPSKSMPEDTYTANDASVPVLASTALSLKPYLNQQHRWPHVEHALFKFRQRHQSSHAEQRESAASHLHGLLPSRRAAVQQEAVAVSGAASDRAHSLTLLGFSDSRTRHAGSWLLVCSP